MDCEAWAVRKEYKLKIQAAQMNVLGRIERVCWKDRITNVEILQRLGQLSRGAGVGEKETGGVERKTRRNGQ